jgi:hypothetical protein
MSCYVSDNKLIKWKIENEDIKHLYKHLYANRELGGKFKLSTGSKNTSKVICSNVGSADTVDSPMAIVNWHTHPVSCYLTAKTVYGWPSGEDLRETLTYGLIGSACHVVPSVEGLYVMQPNPCILLSLMSIDESRYQNALADYSVKDISDLIRGLYILLVEVIFRSTHVDRLGTNVQVTGITIDDFVNFVNSFNFDYDRSTLLKYINEYEYKTGLLCITKKGARYSSGIKLGDLINDTNILDILDKKLGSSCDLPSMYKDSAIKEWNKTQVFKLSFYSNLVKYNGKLVKYVDLDTEDMWNFLNNCKKGDIIYNDNNDVEYYMFDMEGKCNYGHLKDHMKSLRSRSRKGSRKGSKSRVRKLRSKGSKKSFGSRSCGSCGGSGSFNWSFGNRDKIEIIGSIEQCIHCKNAHDRIGKYKKVYDIKFHDYPTISAAVKEATKRAGKSVPGVPAFFKNGVYDEDFNLE